MQGRGYVVDIAAAPQKHLEALRLGRRVVPPGQNPVNLWGGHFFVHRQDVEAVLRNPEVFSNRGGVGNDIRHPPIDYDPPEHSRYRRLLDPIFAPRQVARWEVDIRRIANELIDRFIDRGECDVADEFAFPLPATMFLRLMGVPYDDLDEVLRGGGTMTEADAGGAAATSGRIFGYIERAFEERKAERRDDVLSQLLDFELEGERLTHEEVLGMAQLLFIAGLDTVNSSLQCFFAFLATSPDHRQEIVDDPSIIPNAVEEMMRYESPVPAVSRVVTREFEIADVRVSEGERVAVSLMSANTDPAAVDRPDEVDFHRDANRHLGFGGGVHRCAGSHLARLELVCALDEWHKRIPTYHVKPGSDVAHQFGGTRHVDLRLAFPTTP
jgi:cytochrome P450